MPSPIGSPDLFVTAFRRWIGDRPLTADACKDYLAARREAGYAQRSLLLYYHVLKQLLDADGQQLKMKMRRLHTFPPYYGRSDIERLITQAERGL